MAKRNCVVLRAHVHAQLANRKNARAVWEGHSSFQVAAQVHHAQRGVWGHIPVDDNNTAKGTDQKINVATKGAVDAVRIEHEENVVQVEHRRRKIREPLSGSRQVLGGHAE